MRGKLIVIEGLDGSGKATQAELLFQRLQNQGCRVKKLSFPNYDSDSSALVKMYLNGMLGESPDDVNAYAASSFYAVDRYASYKQDWEEFLRNGGIVIADRYTTSNAIYQATKLPQEEWDSYLSWLFRYEYALLGIPEPDITVYLNVETQVSQQLLKKRYQGDESRKDIHEKDLGYLNRSWKAAAYCAERYGWSWIDCCQDGRMKTMEEIHQDVLAAIDKKDS